MTEFLNNSNDVCVIANPGRSGLRKYSLEQNSQKNTDETSWLNYMNIL